MIETDLLGPDDRDAWERLFRAYLDFYGRSEPDALYERAWAAFQDGTRVHARAARLDGRLVGFTHFFVHPSTSGPDVCYLQDLFTDPEARGRGVARALIAAVTGWAKEQCCDRVYWNTQASNTTARHLYDKVARDTGFIKYQIDLPKGP
ncbi:GNAT family N-acetyltransferase [Streptomyces sp. NPDC048350]|uniref:GNAT family N-acetyltransferase n=1 Tax=Streptomyces sp. NPDC048350 TaxID=3365538 RepID=UPI003720EA29